MVPGAAASAGRFRDPDGRGPGAMRRNLHQDGLRRAAVGAGLLRRGRGDMGGRGRHPRRRRRGTRYSIRMDESDGLISQGDSSTQLTWMDAKCEGIAFTPRQGKPVEINALWYHALVSLGEVELAAKVKGSFVDRFWISPFRGLADVVEGERRDTSIRPNQIIAARRRRSRPPGTADALRPADPRPHRPKILPANRRPTSPARLRLPQRHRLALADRPLHRKLSQSERLLSRRQGPRPRVAPAASAAHGPGLPRPGGRSLRR